MCIYTVKSTLCHNIPHEIESYIQYCILSPYLYTHTVVPGVELGTHDMCSDAGQTREQCHLSSDTEGPPLLWLGRQHHQGKNIDFGMTLYHPSSQR